VDTYCNNADAVWGNLMYWPLEYGNDPSDYFISSKDIDMNTSHIDSQAENVAYFHKHYPNNFKAM
jgi:hypothetical protein